MTGSRGAAAALLLGLLAAAMTVLASPASAHAFLLSSNPADGAVLAAAPTSLRLNFSESVVIGATTVVVTDSAGHDIPVTGLRIVTGADTESRAHIIGTLPPLPRSAYRVSWRTLSSDDLHRTSGLFVFGVGAPVTASLPAEPRPSGGEAALRWLVFLGLATALGGHLTLRLARRNNAAVLVQNRCRRTAAIGAVGAAVTAMALLGDQVWGSGSSIGTVLASRYGERWALRELGLLLLVLASVGRPCRARTSASLVTVGAIGACIGSALLGHAGSSPDALATSTVADAAHLGAAAAWSGTLIVVTLVLFRRAPSATRGLARAVLRDFRLPAALCVSVMVVTGVYLASNVVGSIDAALSTFYGRTLLIKLAAVAVAGGLALVNTTRLRSRTGSGVPWRTVLAETMLAALVLALAAVLTSGQPAREPQFVTTATPAVAPFLDTSVADLQQSLAVQPNRPGRNVVLLGVFDTRRPSPAQIERVLVRIDGIESAADRLGDGRWSVSTELSRPGLAAIRVTVQRGGLPDAVHDYRWAVGGVPRAARTTLVSTAPIGARLRELATVLGVVALLGWCVAFARRAVGPARTERSRTDPGEPVPDLRELVDSS